MTIPVKGAADVGVALGGGALCGEGGKSKAVTSAISCTHQGKEGTAHEQ